MNNRYWKQDCPALMNDARLTNHHRTKKLDQYIKNINNLETSHEYRYFLQKNGHIIFNNERAALEKSTTCTSNVMCFNS
jgi:hypothetical protein